MYRSERLWNCRPITFTDLLRLAAVLRRRTQRIGVKSARPDMHRVMRILVEKAEGVVVKSCRRRSRERYAGS